MATNIIPADDNDDITQCTKHPFKTTSSNNGGICPFCLQLKLSNLVSSSPSFRSHPPSSSSHDFPFLVTPINKPPSNSLLTRSKSTATPRRRGFWSFLTSPLKKNTIPKPQLAVPSTSAANDNDNDNGNGNGDDDTRSFERKVTRSRSVGCGGSKSFSVDLLDRISTGFGDCALRRVESQRERTIKHRHSTSNAMRCGGLFGGFMTVASSTTSSSTSSSSYWVDGNGPRPNGNMAHGRSRSWGWALASPRKGFSANKVAQKSSAIDSNNNNVVDGNNKVPNLDAIPSLLSVRS